MKKGQLFDAKIMFEKAIDLHNKVQDSTSEKQDVEYLNVVINKMKECGIF